LPLPYGEDQIERLHESLRVAPNVINDCRLRRCAVIVDANPAHHKANLVTGDDGSYRSGCRTCFDALSRTHNIAALNAAQLSQAIEAQEDQHRLANAVNPNDPRSRGSIGDMPDLNTLQPEGARWAQCYAAVRPAIQVIDLAEVVRFLREASDQGRNPLNVVASISHGTQDWVFLGGAIHKTLPRNDNQQKNVGHLVAEIRDFLAPDIRWILYACLTAGGNPGGNGIYPDNGGSDTVAAELLNQLVANGKTHAEVWGHVGAGQALARPYWRRFRSQNLVRERPWSAPLTSLFDLCFPAEFFAQMADHIPGRFPRENDIRANAYGLFKQLLDTALQAPAARETVGLGLTHVEQNPSIHIPMWVFDLEDTSLAAACQEAWKNHPGSYFYRSEHRRR